MITKKSIVELRDVKRHFGMVKALNGVTLELLQGEQYVIQGASGSGKSSLLYLIGGLDTPTSGDVVVSDKNLAMMSDDELAAFRNRYVGFVFQFHFLLPSMTAKANILLPAKIAGIKEDSLHDELMRLALFLDVVHCLNKFPYELSGGEQQRINLLRAILLRPKLLLCDEPTGDLDSVNGQKVVELLLELSKEFGTTLVMVTHDNNLALKFEKRIFMKDGLICDKNQAKQV